MQIVTGNESSKISLKNKFLHPHIHSNGTKILTGIIDV